MGKIFDALEKANSWHDRKGSLLPDRNRKGADKSDKGKVVPFINALNVGQEPGLSGNLITYHDPRSVEAELFKALRTNLLFPSSTKPAKSLMITSALPGEGKSFVSANLAISIAKGVEEHVLLIDADIRKPSINYYFGFEQTEGLSEYLVTGSDVSKHFVKSPVEKLTILPAGNPPEKPTELLTSQKMKNLLDEVTQRYEDRYIVIDSAPPSLAAETSAIANFVDGILIVVRAGKTPRSAVTEVIEQIGKEKILGIVMNYSDQSSKKYYGYGKSYYRPESR